jgi:hypothetical protein
MGFMTKEESVRSILLRASKYLGIKEALVKEGFECREGHIYSQSYKFIVVRKEIPKVICAFPNALTILYQGKEVVVDPKNIVLGSAYTESWAWNNACEQSAFYMDRQSKQVHEILPLTEALIGKQEEEKEVSKESSNTTKFNIREFIGVKESLQDLVKKLARDISTNALLIRVTDNKDVELLPNESYYFSTFSNYFEGSKEELEVVWVDIKSRALMEAREYLLQALERIEIYEG